MGNAKKKSRFWCLHYMKENRVLDGIQRLGKQREKFHIKDALCLNQGCQGMITYYTMERNRNVCKIQRIKRRKRNY